MDEEAKCMLAEIINKLDALEIRMDDVQSFLSSIAINTGIIANLDQNIEHLIKVIEQHLADSRN